MWGAIDLAFVRVVEIDLVSVWWLKITRFSVSIEFDLVFVSVVEIDLISLWGMNLT